MVEEVKDEEVSNGVEEEEMQREVNKMLSGIKKVEKKVPKGDKTYEEAMAAEELEEAAAAMELAAAAEKFEKEIGYGDETDDDEVDYNEALSEEDEGENGEAEIPQKFFYHEEKIT